MSLADGDCEAAQAELDEEWDRLRTPRNILLYQAAIDLCRGSTESGRFWFETAEDSYGWVGVAFEVDEFFYDCEIYRSIRSYFEGGDRAAFACESGDYPRWPDGPEDDPRTSEDESVTTLTTSQADDTTTSTQD